MAIPSSLGFHHPVQIQGQIGQGQIGSSQRFSTHRGAEKMVPSCEDPTDAKRWEYHLKAPKTPWHDQSTRKWRFFRDPGLAPAVRRRTATCHAAWILWSEHPAKHTALIFNKKSINTKIFVQIYEWNCVPTVLSLEPQHDDTVALLPGVEDVSISSSNMLTWDLAAFYPRLSPQHIVISGRKYIIAQQPSEVLMNSFPLCSEGG